MDRITRTYTHHFEGSIAEVFPLLCPVREHDYLDDWQADILFSESGVAEKGCIFQTDNPSQIDHSGKSDGDSISKTTWIITAYEDTTGKVEFVMFTPESHVSQLHIQLTTEEKSSDSNGHGSCSAIFTYSHTATTDTGRAFVQKFTQELFDQKMAGFEKSLNQHLENFRSGR